MSASLRVVPDISWLALGAQTESDRPAEWPYVMTVMLHRVASAGYPDDLYAVLRQGGQFSAFNAYGKVGSEAECFEAMRRDLKLAGTKAELLARLCATALLELPREDSALRVCCRLAATGAAVMQRPPPPSARRPSKASG